MKINEPLHPSLSKRSCFHPWDSAGHVSLSRSIILPWGSTFTVLFFCIKGCSQQGKWSLPCLGVADSIRQNTGKEQPPSQNLAQLSAAAVSRCKLSFCFPKAEQELGGWGFQQTSRWPRHCCSASSCSQLLAPQTGCWLRSPMWGGSDGGHRQGTQGQRTGTESSQGISALPQGSSTGESSITLQGQRAGCFLLLQQR